jgi:hypothetical protein
MSLQGSRLCVTRIHVYYWCLKQADVYITNCNVLMKRFLLLIGFRRFVICSMCSNERVTNDTLPHSVLTRNSHFQE